MNKKKTKNEISKELDIAISERDKYLQIAQRAQADLVNLRMKSANDLTESELKAHRRMVFQLISVIDQMNMALSTKVNTKTYKSWIAGMDSILKNFITILENFNFKQINCEIGDLFDPKMHEAISRVKTDEFEPGTIVRQITCGYLHDSHLVRPILVEIAYKKEEKK
jgi:molecular chaperone GrpE